MGFAGAAQQGSLVSLNTGGSRNHCPNIFCRLKPASRATRVFLFLCPPPPCRDANLLTKSLLALSCRCALLPPLRTSQDPTFRCDLNGPRVALQNERVRLVPQLANECCMGLLQNCIQTHGVEKETRGPSHAHTEEGRVCFQSLVLHDFALTFHAAPVEQSLDCYAPFTALMCRRRRNGPQPLNHGQVMQTRMAPSTAWPYTLHCSRQQSLPFQAAAMTSHAVFRSGLWLRKTIYAILLLFLPGRPRVWQKCELGDSICRRISW